MNYLHFLRQAHAQLKPTSYIEIGTRSGNSLSLSSCRSIAIDPAFRVTEPINCDVRIFPQTSDLFFAETATITRLHEAGFLPCDMAFIDGERLFEYAYRDFMNVEKHSHKNTVIFLDDIYPRNQDEALRQRCTKAWTGDVWKIIPCLGGLREDLFLVGINTTPTGLLMIVNADPSNKILFDVAKICAANYSDLYRHVPDYILDRRNAENPQELLDSGFLALIRRHREDAHAQAAKEVQDWCHRKTLRQHLRLTVLQGLPGLRIEKPNFKLSKDWNAMVRPARNIPFEPDRFSLCPGSAQLDPSLPRNRKNLSAWYGEVEDCEALAVGHLHGARCFGGRALRRDFKTHLFGGVVVTANNEIFSRSMRQIDGTRTYAQERLCLTENAAYLKDFGPGRHEKGDFYYIGEASRHFGHFVLEGLAALCGLEQIPQGIKSNMRFVISEGRIPKYVKQVYDLIEIGEDRIVSAEDNVRVESLYYSTLTLRTHHWCAPEQAAIWEKISRRAAEASGLDPESPPHRHIFLSRRNVRN